MVSIVDRSKIVLVVALIGAAAGCARSEVSATAPTGAGTVATTAALTTPAPAPTTPPAPKPFTGDLRTALVPVPTGAEEQFGNAGKDRKLSAAEFLATRMDEALTAADLTQVGFRDGAVRQWRSDKHAVIVTLLQLGGQDFQTVRMIDLQKAMYKGLEGEDPRVETVAGLPNCHSFLYPKGLAGQQFSAVVCQHADVMIDVNVIARTSDVARNRVIEVAKAQYAKLP